LTSDYNVFTGWNGRRYKESSLDFYRKKYGDELKETPLKQSFLPSIKLKRPFYLDGKEIKEINEISYILKEEEGFSFFELNYPMNYSEMSNSVPIDSIVLHHTGNSYSIPKLLELHMNFFSAIGYHYIIQEDGSVVNTRPVHYQGAHVGRDTNKGKIGISFCLNLNEKEPNRKMKSSCKRLLDYLKGKYNLDKDTIFLHREIQIMKINDFLYSNGFEKEFIDREILNRIYSKGDFKTKKKSIVDKIFEKNLDEKVRKNLSVMIKRLTTCPGIYFNLMRGNDGKLRKTN